MAYMIANSGAKLVLFGDSAAWQSVINTDKDVSCVERVLAF
jgi:hypothetical protein